MNITFRQSVEQVCLCSRPDHWLIRSLYCKEIAIVIDQNDHTPPGIPHT